MYARFTNSIDKRCMEVKTTEQPLNRSVSGYGSAIPTQYLIKYKNRWRRVYCSIFSNSGTLYIDKRLYLTLTIFDGELS